MAYSKDIDYQALINESVAKGDYASASKFEQSRNEKIEKEGLSYEKTDKYKKPSGVDDTTYNKLMNSKFNESSSVSNLDKKTDKAYSNYEKIASNKNIISDKVWQALNSKFEVPSAVTEADAYLKTQLEKIQSGKTSYSDQVKDMMDKIMNRDKFSYDVDSDPLFQQALASAMNSGKQAMQDTIGQASALTGGYGSTYATSAGNQAYNSFIEDAYNNLPQYYQMALEAYQMEGDEMYRQFGMLSDLDDKEFNRNLTAYDATYAHRNQMYNEAYAQFRDNKSDAFNMANLQLSEHGQQASDAYNLYNAAANNADRLYAREYQKWSDEINQAMQYAQMLNSDWWNKTNFDENVREYEKSFAEDVRQFDTSFAENQRQFNENLAENKRQYDTTMAENKRQFDAQYALQSAKASGSSRSSSSSGSKTSSKLTDAQIKGIQNAYRGAGGGTKGYDAVRTYLKGIGKDIDAENIDIYLSSANAQKGLQPYYQDWTISKDTKNRNNPFSKGNEDMNDVYTNLNGDKMTYKELKKSVNESNLSDEEKQAFLNDLKKQSKR